MNHGSNGYKREVVTAFLRNNRARLSKKDIQDLIKQYQASGDPVAMESILRSNIGLAVSFARRYCRNCRDFDDLVSEAILALIKSVIKFNQERGCDFLQLAGEAIRNALFSYLVKGKPLNCDRITVQRIKRVLQINQDLAVRLGRSPFLNEIKEEFQRLYPKSRRQPRLRTIALDLFGLPKSDFLADFTTDSDSVVDNAVGGFLPELQLAAKERLVFLLRELDSFVESVDSLSCSKLTKETFSLRYGLHDSCQCLWGDQEKLVEKEGASRATISARIKRTWKKLEQMGYTKEWFEKTLAEIAEIETCLDRGLDEK